MGKVHAGMAKHGQAWFAKDQTAGKGQRGNVWVSQPEDNIILTVSLQPGSIFPMGTFYFNAFVALTCIKFLQKWDEKNFTIKWPNDLYWRDRKAGGILIENVIQGSEWRWAVVGIGINVNQADFPDHLKNPVSLNLITDRKFDAVELGKQLHTMLMEDFSHLPPVDRLLNEYNQHLYQKNKEVKLKKENSSFFTRIKEVDSFGNLQTEDTMERSFKFGEVSWI